MNYGGIIGNQLKQIRQNYFKVRSDFLALALPDYCLGCDQDGCLLCPSCLEKMVCRPVEICPICKAVDESDHCSGSLLQSLWALARYQDYLIADSIQKIKYEYLTGLVQVCWHKYLDVFWQQAKEAISPDTILIPVPLHRKRLLERGFNQSELVANELSVISGLAMKTDLLSRIIYNEPQVGLNGALRLANVQGIFSVNYKALAEAWGREIILIDDVYTTGSTMAECARVLKTAGFRKVSGLVLAVD